MTKENYLDNKSKTSALISCTHQDYQDACNDICPTDGGRHQKKLILNEFKFFLRKYR